MTSSTLKSTSYQVTEDLERLGVIPGDILMVHSSIKSLGIFDGGLEAITTGFLNAIGSKGTLLMPSLCWTITTNEIFDPKSTASIVGVLPEYFRQRQGTIRSIHPTHSVSGIGSLANDLIEDHVLDRTPCGAHSPFRKITQTNGKIVMLGCGLRPNTTMHALEEFVVPPYLFGPETIYHLRFPDGSIRNIYYRAHNFLGWEQRYDRISELQSSLKSCCFIKSGYVLQAYTYLIDARGLRQAVLDMLLKNPLFFVDKTEATN